MDVALSIFCCHQLKKNPECSELNTCKTNNTVTKHTGVVFCHKETLIALFSLSFSLHLGKNDLLTFYDGDDLTANILGQYSGTRPHFKLYTSMADVTIQFQSDPATNIYGYNNGFVVHFFGTCQRVQHLSKM